MHVFLTNIQPKDKNSITSEINLNEIILIHLETRTNTHKKCVVINSGGRWLFKVFVTFSWRYISHVMLSSQKFPKWCQMFFLTNCYNFFYLNSLIYTISSLILNLPFFIPPFIAVLHYNPLSQSCHSQLHVFFNFTSVSRRYSELLFLVNGLHIACSFNDIYKQLPVNWGVLASRGE